MFTSLRVEIVAQIWNYTKSRGVLNQDTQGKQAMMKQGRRQDMNQNKSMRLHKKNGSERKRCSTARTAMGGISDNIFWKKN